MLEMVKGNKKISIKFMVYAESARYPTYQRAILNFNPGPLGRNSPPGVNLASRGEIWPLGGMFTPSF
jgi:hypothetical protein